jgi:hypothetical protein
MRSRTPTNLKTKRKKSDTSCARNFFIAAAANSLTAPSEKLATMHDVIGGVIRGLRRAAAAGAAWHRIRSHVDGRDQNKS